MRTVDLLFFMGQSNMAGRGEAALAPVVAPGMGYEYRAVTDPDTLHPLEEPFGVNENDPAGVYEPGMKTGAMVSSFVNACTAQTGVPVVGVSCAKGGSAIAKWLPGTPYYQDAVRRARKARAFLQANGYPIRHSAMVWCQGCTDGDLHTPKTIYPSYGVAPVPRSSYAEDTEAALSPEPLAPPCPAAGPVLTDEPLQEQVARYEAALIAQAMQQEGSLRGAARKLHMDPATLLRRKKKYQQAGLIGAEV